MTKGVSNVQHSILPFHKENNASQKQFKEYCQYVC